MTHWLLGIAVALFYILHQDTWFWETARPLVFGFLPVGLFYHAAYSVAVALLMVALTRWAWPTDLEQDADAVDGARPSSVSKETP